VEVLARSDGEDGRAGYRAVIGLVAKDEAVAGLAHVTFLVEGDLATVAEDGEVVALTHRFSDPGVEIELTQQLRRRVLDLARERRDVLSLDALEDIDRIGSLGQLVQELTEAEVTYGSGRGNSLVRIGEAVLEEEADRDVLQPVPQLLQLLYRGASIDFGDQPGAALVMGTNLDRVVREGLSGRVTFAELVHEVGEVRARFAGG
jgi:hypothetical protein